MTRIKNRKLTNLGMILFKKINKGTFQEVWNIPFKKCILMSLVNPHSSSAYGKGIDKHIVIQIMKLFEDGRSCVTPVLHRRDDGLEVLSFQEIFEMT